MVEAVGQVILSLHNNLAEIRAQLETNGAAQGARENVLLQATLDRAEAALRDQARQLCAVAAVDGVAPAASTGLPAPSAKRAPLLQQGLPPALGRSALPPAPPWPPGPPTWSGELRELRSRSSESFEGTQRRQRPVGGGQSQGLRHRSKTAAPQRALPRPNRLDPLSDAPALTEQDLAGGLYNLSTRGFIPPTADLTPAMERGLPVVHQRAAPLYDQSAKHVRREIALADNQVLVKRDLRPVPPSLPFHGDTAPDQIRTRARTTSPCGARVFSARTLPPLEAPPGSSHPSWSPENEFALVPLPAPPPTEYPATATAATRAGAQGYSDSGGMGTFFTELLEASPEGGQLASVYEPPDPEEIKAEAVTCIAAFWRGHLQRQEYEAMLHQSWAARKIQSNWATSLARMATKMELLRVHDEDRELHGRLLAELGQDWFQKKQMRHVEVHISSLTLPEHRRDRMESFQARQASQIARIFRLVDSKRDVIFVAPKQLHEDILDYYSKIMQFRGVRNPPARFQVVVPEHMGLTSHMSVSQGLLCSPKAMRRVRRLVGARQAYIVPDAMTHTEIRLAGNLQLPLLGLGPKNMALLSSKSNGKKLAQLAEVPVGPWVVDIYDEDEFYTSLAGLVVKFPQVRMWVFKIDDERDSRGHAYLDLSKLREVADVLRATAKACGGSADAPEDPALVEEVRLLLRRHVPKRVSLCNRKAYPDFAAWMAEVSRVGAIIQAVPENLISQVSVHLQIDPDGSVLVTGSSEAVMCQPFVRAASFFPHTRGNWEVLHEVGIRMGRVLASKGAVGFASIDVVFFENPHFDASRQAEIEREETPVVIGSGTPVDPRHLMFSELRSPSPSMSAMSDGAPSGQQQMPARLTESRQADYELAVQLQELERSGKDVAFAKSPVNLMLGAPPQVGASPASRFACWVVDIDARLTDEACAMAPIQFIAQLRLHPETGTLRLSPAAQKEQQSLDGGTVAQQLTEQEQLQRCALVSFATKSPSFREMSHQNLFQTAKMRGVSFDLFHNVGCVFTYLELVHSLFSLMAVDRTPEHCAKRMSAAMGALAEGVSKPAGQATRPKVAAPQDVPGPPGLEASGALTVTDVQTGLRAFQRRWGEKQRQS